MNINVIAVGKLKEKFWKDACSEYAKRISGYAKLTIREIPDVDPGKNGGALKAKEKEGEAVLAAISGRSHVILLAIEGKMSDSETFAGRLEELAVHGESDITFVIGGSDGSGSKVYERADELISFGPITMPHNLARVVLLEQIYRAFKIIKKEPYHK